MALTAAQIAWCAAVLGASTASYHAPPVVKQVKAKIAQAAKTPVAKGKRVQKAAPATPVAHRAVPASPSRVLDCPTPGLSAGTELMEIAPIKPLETAPAFPGTGFVVEDYSIIGRPGDVPAIPEGTTWLYMIAGFGLVGMAARQRRAA
jgi:hypothetical protein